MKTSGGYSPGDFDRLLHRLNPRLKVIYGTGDRSGWASVYWWSTYYDPELSTMLTRREGNWEQICGLPPGYIPERTIRRNGKIYKRGWREVLSVLSSKRLIRIPRELGGKEGILRHGRVVDAKD